MQFGEGNFLRTFVDLYLDALNKEGNFNYEVTIVKSVPFGSIEQLRKQKCKYHIVLRGRSSGKDVEDVYHVDSVKDAIDLYEETDSFFRLAEDPEVKLIVSNTTEAGIVFNQSDKQDAFPDVTYPAKLTLWLPPSRQRSLQRQVRRNLPHKRPHPHLHRRVQSRHELYLRV